jgi:naphthoate synthase
VTNRLITAAERSSFVDYQDIDVSTEDSITTITIDRPDAGNKFRKLTALELADSLRQVRDSPDVRVAILTGAGDKFFCIGGEHEPASSVAPFEALPIIDVYELIDAIPKPVVAAVNGFAVGGGNVLAQVCDLTIAASHAIFRQVGPIVGSYDTGFGTWYLETAIGRKRAKEMWYLNRKYSASDALAMGLVNEVVDGPELQARAREIASELLTRSPLALGALKGAFSARHTGVIGAARMGHDQMLSLYLATSEAHEVNEAFNERRAVNPAAFLH